MKKTRLISRIIAAVLAVCIVFSNQGMNLLSSAAEKDQELEEQYVKEVKMFYSYSAEAGKEECEAAGFTFCPENLMEDSGSDVQAYLGYKTTKDEGDAITDMTLLDMKNSHYEETTYKKFLDDHISDFADEASQVMTLVNEFRKQYEAGSPNALAAYDSLNMFYMDENKSHKDTANLLGRYILEEADIAFFEKYIQRGNAQILNAVINHLANAASDYEEDKTTWVDRAQESDILEKYQEADSAERNQYDTWYQDPAKRLVEEIQTLTSTYKEAKKLYDKYGDTFGYEESAGIDKETTIDEMIEADPNCRIPEYMGAMLTYDLLDQMPYGEGDGTLGKYFLELGDDGNLGDHPESVYPFISSMSSAQTTTLSLAGLSVLAKSLYQAEDYESKRKEICSKAAKRIEEYGFEDGKIYLWENVDQSLYNLKAVQTSDAIEAEHAGTELINSINEAAREAASNLTLALQITDITLLALSGIFMIVQAVVGTTLWTVGMGMFAVSGFAMTLGLTGTVIGYGLAGVLCCACFVLSIVVLVASLAYLVYTILDMCGVFDKVELADYSKIPNILFHVRKNQKGNYYVRYDAVPSNATIDWMTMLALAVDSGATAEEIEAAREQMNSKEWKNHAYNFFNHFFREDVSDMAAFQGRTDRWLALYATKAPACGDPIKVVPGESIIKTQKNDYKAPAGCKPVTLVGGGEAADINSVEISGEAGKPLYMFMVKDPNAEESESEEETSHETKESDQYITRVRLVHADKKEDAVNSLKKSNFMDYIDVNLTPYSGHTYIGYQMGSKAGALTDIRVSNTGTDPIVYGDASYGKQGLTTDGMTPDAISLYATTDKNAGTPITKITVENKRLELGSGAEPVCLFSGGNAVDFKHKWSDNYNFDVAQYDKAFFKDDVEVNQDEPDGDGYYIYFWPETQYKAESKESQAPYVSGFSYFLAVSSDDDDNRYGSHAEFMQRFAKANGFELIMDGDSPMKMMSDTAATMNPEAHWQDCEGGMMGHDWRYDIFHYMEYGAVSNFSDGGLDNFTNCKDVYEDQDQDAKLYFGVSYTYNPYRAVTGISGLITPYTETSHNLRYTGLQTPAGTMQVSNLSIQGNPTTQAGISYGYYSYTAMPMSLYPNTEAKQKSGISWLSGGNTETLTHYLLTSGPTAGRNPIKRDDLKFVSKENPGQYDGYVPLCDIRTPGDYSNPMNLALDTVNIGSKYLYMYIKNSAGGRTGETDDNVNCYEKKHYVAAVFCGTGKTPEEAMNSLYSKAAGSWPQIAVRFPDVSKTPLVTEFDEVLPIDLSDQTPWYQQYRRDTDKCDPSDNEWVYGNDAANLRWGHRQFQSTKVMDSTYNSEQTPDDKEATRDYAYIGVVRTSYPKGTATITEKDENGNETTTTQTVYPAYALLKYYYDASSAPATLSVDTVKCTLAGGPVKSKEGQYYLYYSANSATAAFSAPITDINLSSEAFVNGFNTSFSCSETDRVNNVLPAYSELRMRTDEYKYIHTKYDMDDLPYIEQIYVGIGKNKKEAYADLIGTTNANAATTVDCNHNSYSDKWIAIGYRRTKEAKDAVRDVFLYAGEDPPDSVQADGYIATTTKVRGKLTTSIKAGKITYTLLKHNLKKGSETLSLNEGGGSGLYLYYTGRKQILYENSLDKEITPIRNMAFGYGDISPAHASAEELAEVYGATLHGKKIFDLESYKETSWEYVTGVEDTPGLYKVDGSVGKVMSLNYGQLPIKGNTGRHTGDQRVIMYVDHADTEISGQGTVKFAIRSDKALTNAGYYSATSKHGILTQGE